MQGSDFEVSVTFRDKAGALIDLTGCAVRLMVKREVDDLDADAVVELNSTDHPDSFSLVDAADGKVVGVVGGSYTAGIAMAHKKEGMFVQLEASLDGRYYRTDNLAFDLSKAVIGS